MRQLMSRVFLGESLLIFWKINVLIALSDDDHITIWEKPLPNDFICKDENLPLDSDVREYINEGESKKYFFQYAGDDSVNISFIVSPCKSAEIRWILKYTKNNESEDGKAITLVEYIGNNYHIYVGNANPGFYWLEIQSSWNTFMYSIYVTLRTSFVQVLREVKYNNQRSIAFKKNLKELRLSMKWPKWNWSDGLVMYRVIISDEKYTACGCEFDHYNRASETVATYNTSYKMDESAVPGNKYYISIFITTRNAFLLPYLQGDVTFPKSKPIILKDGMATRGTLASHNGKLTYRYKVRNRQFAGSNNEIIWYVISCVGPIYVEINHKKDAVISKQTVNGYRVFKISQPRIGNRYVMKIVDPSSEDGEVEVFATMRPKLFTLPNVNNLTVVYNPNLDYHVAGRASFIIAWNAASDEEIVSYCIFYKEIEISDYANNYRNIDHCSRGIVIRNMTKLRAPCKKYKRGSGVILTEYLNNVDETADYLVYVSARKRSSKRRIWYDPILITARNASPMIFP